MLFLFGVVLCLSTEFTLPQFIHSPKFSTEIQLRPKRFLNKTNTVNVVYNGVEMQCLLPNADTTKESKGKFNKNAIKRARGVISKLSFETYVARDDNWGWLVNFKKDVVQFEPRLEKSTYGFLMDPRLVVENAGVNKLENVLPPTEPVIINNKLALRATYGNGNYCATTGTQRETTVYFVCDENNQLQKPKLLSVIENRVCAYDMVWGFQQLCSIPEFAIPAVKPNKIVCIPDEDVRFNLEEERVPLVSRAVPYMGHVVCDEQTQKWVYVK